MTNYYNDELYHFGVKGMRWGHRKAQYNTSNGNVASAKVRMKNAKQAYKTANKAYGKSFNKAARYSSNHFITQNFGKGKQKSNALWNDAYDKGSAADKAKAAYKQSKKDYKAEKKAAANTPEAKAARKEKMKKAAKVGAAVAGTALAAYGAYKVSKAIKDKNVQIMERKGREAANKYWNDNWTDHTVSKYKSGSTIVTSRNASSQTYTKFSNADSAEKWINRIKDQNKNVSAKADKIYEDYYYKGKNAKLGEAAKNVYQYYRHRK